MAAEEVTKKDDGVAIELPAPAGWVKKIISKKGGTPQRSDIVFVSPMGEEIKNKRQLEQYLKSHPGGPAASEFDWATGDTPRRSARLSEKSKAVEALASQPPMKKQKRSSTKRGAKKSNTNAEEDITDEKDAVAEETKESSEVPDADTKDVREDACPTNPTVEDATNETETETHPEKPNAEDVKKKIEIETETETEAYPENPNAKDAEKETGTDAILEEPSAPEPPINTNTNKSNSDAEDAKTAPEVPDTKNDESEDVKTAFEVSDTKNDESKDAKTASEVPVTKNDESKDAHAIEKEPLAAPVDNVEPPAAAANVESLKEKQAAENPNNNNIEPVTGS